MSKSSIITVLLVLFVGSSLAVAYRWSDLSAKMTSNNVEVQSIKESDSILTYRVLPEEKKWSSWNPDGTKIYPDEFLKNKPDASESEIKKAKDAQEYNEWSAANVGKIWYETFDDTIKDGKLRNTLIDKGLCGLVKKAWQGDKAKSMSYKAFVDRMTKQADLIGAKLTSVPLINYGYVAYYFRDKKKNVHIKLAGSGRSLHRINTLRLRNAEDILKYNAKEKDFYSKIIPESSAFQEFIGVDEHWSAYPTSWTMGVISEDDGTFRLNVPLSRKAFVDFYEKDELKTPPDYFIRVFEFWLAMQKENVVDDKLKNIMFSRNLSDEELQAKKQFLNEDVEKYYDGELEFIKSERRIGFRVTFALPSGIKHPPNRTHWLIDYNVDLGVSEDKEYEDVISSVSCGVGVFNGSWNGAVKFTNPYYAKYPWSKINKCRPYKNWLQCHQLNFQKVGVDCNKISKEEPRMCEE